MQPAQRTSIILIGRKRIHTPFFFPVLYFYCGGNEDSAFGGGPYRQLKEQYLNDSTAPCLFDGVLTSVTQLHDFGQSSRIIDECLKESISARFRYDGVIFVDSGGYKLLNSTKGIFSGLENSPMRMRRRVQRYQEGFGPDIYVPLDYPPKRGMNGAAFVRRAEFTVESHVFSLRNRIRTSLLYGVVHGHNPKSVRTFFEILVRSLEAAGYDLNDFDGLSLGGLVPIKNDYRKVTSVFNEFRRMAEELSVSHLPRHVFGLSSSMLPLLSWLGADTFDSLSYLYAAMYGKYYLEDLSTVKISEVDARCCDCIVCSNPHLIRVMKGLENVQYKYQRVAPLAIHNLSILQREMIRIRTVINREEMDMFDYLVSKFSSRPRLAKVVKSSLQLKLDSF